MNTIAIINGPNINMLGFREPHIYGTEPLKNIQEKLTEAAKQFNVELVFFQSNCEGNIIDELHKGIGIYKAAILNAAAYSHTSIAIRDAISSINYPVIEVHISNIYAREKFRHKSIIAPACVGSISGFGWYSYMLGLQAAVHIINTDRA